MLSPGANARVTPKDVDAAATLIRRANVVLLQLELPPATVRHAMRRAQAANVPVVLDPAPAPLRREPWMFKADVLCPNQTEAASLLGPSCVAASDAPDRVAARLAAAGPRHVVLKLGAAGSMHADATGVFTHAAGLKVDAVDTTAAGDAFTAALAVARAEGESWADALRFANAAGALACTTLGAWPSIPTRRAVSELLSRTRSS